MDKRVAADDYRRPVLLDVTRDGIVYVREAGGGRNEDALPFFSAHTIDDAEQLRILHCHRLRDGSGLYRLNQPPSGYEDLGRLTEMFRISYQRLREARGQ